MDRCPIDAGRDRPGRRRADTLPKETPMDRHRDAPHADPIPAAIAEFLWLGGEAMVAPTGLAERPCTSTATERDAEPSWVAI
jgi:hypothetical protein